MKIPTVKKYKKSRTLVNIGPAPAVNSTGHAGVDMLVRKMRHRLMMLAVAGLSIVGCESTRYVEVFYPEVDVDRVVVRSTSGSVDLISGNRLRVERAVRAPEGALTLSHQVRVDENGSEVLHIEAICKPLIPCSVDISLAVPDGVSVDVYLEQGEVWATGISSLNAEINRGSLDADINGPVTAQVGYGDADVDLPAGTDATIAVGRGNIILHIPEGPWDLTLSADQVVIDEKIIRSDTAPGRVELLAPAGLITVGTPMALANAD
jgi:hypothetical protein